MTALHSRTPSTGQGTGGRRSHVGDHSEPTLLHIPDTRRPRHISEVLAEVAGDLTRIHPRAFDVFLDGYQAGYRDGHQSGYALRAQHEADEWIPVRDHLTAYVKSFHGLKQRRAQRKPVPQETPAQMVANAHASWGLPIPEQEGT